MGRDGSARFDAAIGRLPARAAGWLLLAAWFFEAPLRAADRIGASFDHRFYYALAEITRKALVEQGTLPLWNPYFCGGIPHLANPTVSIVVPTLPLTLLFGAAVGPKLAVVTLLVMGLEGTYRLARRLGADPTSALVAGPVFALSGEMAVWLESGQDFLGVLLLPWVFTAALGAMDGDRRAVITGAFFLAWMIGTVPAYPVLWCPLLVGPWMLAEVVARARAGNPRRALGAILWTAAIALLGAGLAAVRLVPMLEVFADTPRRVVAAPDATGVRAVAAALVDGGLAHVGVGALVLAALGLAVAPRHRGRLAGLAALFAVLAMGDAGGLWRILVALPLYENLRYAMRLLALLALVLGVLASLGTTSLRRAVERWRPGLGAPVALAALALVLVTLLPTTKRMLGDPYTVPEVPRRAQPFAQSRGNHWENQIWPRVDRGTLACYEETPFHTSPAVRGDLEREERLADPSAGTVRRRAWAASRLDLDVDLTREARLLVNQNWSPGWRSSAGRVVSSAGALAVDLPRGRRRVTLRYRPTAFWIGLGVSAATLLALLADHRRRRDRSEGGHADG